MSAAPGSLDTHQSNGGAPLSDPGQVHGDPHEETAGVDPQPAADGPTKTTPVTRLADSLLLIYADALDDLEKVRIGTENRVRSLAQVKGMDGTPEQARLQGIVDALRAQEHACELELKRAMRKHPLGPWVKATVGIGEKQGARLLAAIGDPASRRTVSQLWAYCGYHVVHPGQGIHDAHHGFAGVDSSSNPAHTSVDAHMSDGGVAPKRRKGQLANWNGTAKMRAYLCAESCMKQRTSPFRSVYDKRRAHTAETHPDWSDGHSHNDALRIVAKAILRDLWVEARRLNAKQGSMPKRLSREAAS